MSNTNDPISQEEAAFLSREEATSPSNLNLEASPDIEIFLLNVRGVPFAIDAHHLTIMSSSFLTNLFQNINFAVPSDGVYQIDIDAEAFSAILHHSRFGILSETSDNETLLATADFLDMTDRVLEAISSRVGRLRDSLDHAVNSIAPHLTQTAENYIRRREEFESSQKHHNKRKDDGARRIYCDSGCGCRDFDMSFAVGDKYTTCTRCKKQITYQPNLGWCHKCKRCLSCQGRTCTPFDEDEELKEPDTRAVSRNLREFVSTMSAAWLLRK